MKILTIVSGGKNSNGALFVAMESSYGLAARGHDVTVLTPEATYVSRTLDRQRVNLIHSPLNRWPLTELNRISQWIRQNDIDVIHTHCSRASAFGVLLRRIYGVPVVATAHAMKIQLHWCLNDHVVAVSDAARRFHMRRNLVPSKKISTVLNPIDIDRFRPLDQTQRLAVRESLGATASTILLGIVGSVIPRKGHGDAVAAMATIVERFPDARLVIVGRGSDEDITRVKKVAEQLGVQNHLIWLGHRNDVASLMAAMDAVLCPSLEEPCALVAPETLACEVPVIASAVGGFVTTVQHGETGYLVRAKAPKEIAEAAIHLIRNPSLRSHFGKQGRKWVQEHLSPDAHFTAITNIYQSVIDKSSYHRRINASSRTA